MVVWVVRSEEVLSLTQFRLVKTRAYLGLAAGVAGLVAGLGLVAG